MKSTSLRNALLCTALILSLGSFLSSCKKTTLTDSTPSTVSALTTSNSGPTPGSGSTSNCLAYVVTVMSSYNATANQTTFTWTLTNSNPGNGSNGTAKDLSHWDLTLCQRAADNIVSVSNSLGVQVSASYISDPAMTCFTSPVLKFGYGTSGTTPTTYSAVFTGKYSVGTMIVYFKAGTNCCSNTVPGVSCELPVTCTLSQGYWFGNAAHSWNGATVTIGGFTYTQAEGQALWDVAPGGRGGAATGSFYQAAALKLSNTNVPVSITADLAIIDASLATLGKLSPPNIPTLNNTNVRAAADSISMYIQANECQ